MGSLCRNQAEEHVPSQPLPRCSMRLLFSSIHCYLDPSSDAALCTRELRELLAARTIIGVSSYFVEIRTDTNNPRHQ